MSYHAPEFLKLSSVRTVTPNANTVVSLDEAKLQLNINYSDQDDLITDLLGMADEVISKSIGKPLLPTQLQIDLYTDQNGPQTLYFDQPRGERFKEIYIPVQNLITVDSVSIDGVDVDESTYSLRLGGDQEMPYIRFGNSITSTEVISIGFTAGYDPVPKGLKQASKLYIGHLYENRELLGYGTQGRGYELPFAVDVLTAPYLNDGIFGAGY